MNLIVYEDDDKDYETLEIICSKKKIFNMIYIGV